MADLASMQRIKALLHHANGAATVHDQFAAAIADPNCDKHNIGFNVDSRFSAFSVTVSFDCLTGYYGNSSCSTFWRADKGVIGKAFIKALNIHQRELLATTARVLREEAVALTDKARAEVDALQAVLNELEAPSTSDGEAA